jgi:putative ABC transport system permease protein
MTPVNRGDDWPKGDIEAELDEELRFHLERRREEYEDSGATPDEARGRALRKFGDVSYIRAETLTIDQRLNRRAARAEAMSALLHDIRYALRTIRLTPGFTTVATLTLALGIGVTTVMFSVVDGILLRPLPYASGDRLVSLREIQETSGETPAAFPEYLLWKEQSRPVLSDVAAWFQAQTPLSGSGEAEMLQGERMSANLPAMLGVTPLVGRSFRPEEESTTSEPVIMISEGLWRRRFAADSAIIGRVLTLGGRPATVIGVFPSTLRARLPNELTSGRRTDYWMPLRLTTTNAPAGLHFMYVMGRLEPGVTVAQVAARLNVVARQVSTPDNTVHELRAAPMATQVAGSTRGMLGLLVASVGILLLIACVNVANLLMARAAARTREFGIRLALGASRGRIVNQLLAESVVRALLGGILGAALAYGGVWAMRHGLQVQLPRFEVVTIDERVLTFTLLLSVLVGLVFGVVPALGAARGDPRASLGEAARGVFGSVRRDRYRRLLVAGEVALSFVLLVGAGLLLRSFERVLRVPLGFESRNAVTAMVALPFSRYTDSTRQRSFFSELLSRMEATPGVDAVGLTSSLPIEGGVNGGVLIEGKEFPPDRAPLAEKRIVSAGYLQAMQARVVSGRRFDQGDVSGGPLVVMVNEAFVRNLLPGEDPVGKRVAFQWGIDGMQTIVGVVADMREGALREDVPPAMYVPFTQRSIDAMYIVVRGALPSPALTTLVRETVSSMDPNLALAELRTLDDILANGVSTERVMASLLGTFASLALLLAAVGLYGVISYSVAQRTQELGVRAALGARQSDLMGLVLRQGTGVLLVGLVVGAIAAFGFSGLISSQLYGIGPRDPATFAIAGTLLAVVTLAATFVPALRATRSDPLQALRAE